MAPQKPYSEPNKMAKVSKVQKKFKKIGVVIPALNEEKAIRRVL